jgi:FkbM family methyltransferase
MSYETHKIMKRWVENNLFAYYLLLPAIYLRRQFLKYQNLNFEKFYASLIEMAEENSIVVKIPDFLGSFEIDYRSHILKRILRSKQYEPEIIKLFSTYIDPKRDVIDIGANIGLYTVLFSKTISSEKKVLSIEPTPLALKYLYRNIKRNKVEDSVIVFEGIVSDSKGKCHINVIEGMEEYSSLKKIVHQSVKGLSYKKIMVKGDTIDTLVERYNMNPGFIKIDTEGAEYSVLCGALNTIQTHKPVILSELSGSLLSNFGVNFNMVINLLQDNGYKVRNVDNNQIPPKISYEGEILALPIETSDKNISLVN